MKRPVYLIYFALAALQLAVASSSVVEAVKVDEEPNSDSLPWAPERYPSSPNEVACHSGASNRFCDPDSMLSQADRQLLSKSLKDSPTRRILLPPKCNGPQQRETSSEEVQFGVALLRKMDLETPGSSSLSAHNGHPAKAAEIFARKIHDTWGVGMVTAYCGGTGILLFLSEQDRSIYLSRGTALESVLTDRRLDKTIESVKPLLSQGLYGAAILSALRELDNYLIAGRPGWRERASDFFASYLVLVMISGACAIVAKAICDDRKQRRGYAKVASHLNELDRARATALQGRFQAKSCPICLEDFQVIEGSHCNETEKFTQNGSDGLPLRLLRCGHIFDETCWAEWVSSGHHGKVDKCPICQQNVGKPLRDEKLTDVRRAVTETTSASVSDQWRQQRLEEERNRAIRQYTYDRNFRLMQLGTRYPQFVRPQQIQTWSQVGYDGSLANDPSFVNSDPVRQAAAAASAGNNHFGSGGSGGTGFGGGSSGGGRSGQW